MKLPEPIAVKLSTAEHQRLNKLPTGTAAIEICKIFFVRKYKNVQFEHPKNGPDLKVIISSNNIIKVEVKGTRRNSIAEKNLKISTDYFSWCDSRAFSIGKSGEGFIYLLEEYNEQRHKTASNLIEKLKTLQDPETNSEVIKKVYLKEEIFHGDSMDIMPDLVIEPSRSW